MIGQEQKPSSSELGVVKGNQMPDDEKIVEVMARAMCEAYRENPDTLCILFTGLEGPLWRNYLLTARRQLAAHRAMIKAEDKSCKS